MRLTVAGPTTRAERPQLDVAHRTSLLGAYTSATIVGGFLALALTTVLVPLSAGIAIPGLPPSIAAPAGVLAWILFGLAGGTRVLRDPGSHGALTFHLPFITAAMILGGPTAGAWVAALATFDQRELREAPWYGVLANHAALALSALAGGLVIQVVVRMAELLVLPGSLVVALVAGIAGTMVLAVLSAAFTVGVIVLRDGLAMRDTVAMLDASFRSTAVAETVLGWLFVVVWVTVGWWAPALCTAIVLTLWRAAADARQLDRDELTGTLSRRAFAVRAAEAAERARRGIEGSAYLFLDLDGFKAMNDGPRNHLVGDQVLEAVGERLRRCVRITDAVGRRGGDEFMVLFAGVGDEDTAERLAQRVRELVTAPYATADGEKNIGVSIGVAMLVPGRRDFEPDVRQHADAAMYEAKAEGGGIRFWREPAAA